MADYKTAGAHQLNHWLWSKLQGFVYKGSEQAFKAYGSGEGQTPLVPIIPSQQTPEFTEIAGGPPFIVYNYTAAPSVDDWWTTNENCVYIVYDANEERLRAIYHYMFDLLRREDWTVAEVNDWLAASPGYHFEFKTLAITSSSAPDQFNDEGGRQGAMVVVRYSYTYDLVGTEGNGLRVD